MNNENKRRYNHQELNPLSLNPFSIVKTAKGPVFDFNLILDNISDNIWILDLETMNIVYTSPSIKSLSGYSPEDFINKPTLSILFTEEDFLKVQSIIAEKLHNDTREVPEQDHTYEFQIIHKDGHKKWIEVTAKFLRDDQGNPVQILGLTRDIEYKKKTELALIEKEQKFRSLIENAADVISIVNRAGKIIYESPAHKRVLGYDHGELIGENGFDLIHSEDVERMNKQFLVLLGNPGKMEYVQFRFRHKDGSFRRLEGTAKNLIDDPSINGIVVNYHDITEQQKIKDELNFERDLFRSFLDYVPNAIYFKDLDGKFLEVNQSLADEMNVSKEQMIGKSDFDFYPDSEAQQRFDDEKWIIENNKPIKKEEKGLTPLGEKWFYTTKAPRYDSDGNVVGTFGISWNITQRKKAEKALVESEKRYHSLFESANDSIFIMESGIFIDCNIKTMKTFGCNSKVDIIGSTPWNFSPEYQPDGTKSYDKAIEYLSLASNGHPQRFYWKHLRPDKTTFDAEVSLSKLNITKKEQILAIVHDISNRVNSEIALRESEEKFRSISANALDGIIMLDPEGKIYFWNRAAENIFGYTAEETLGKELQLFISPEEYQYDYKLSIMNFPKSVKGSIIGKTIELTAINKEKKKFPIELSISSLKMNDKWYAVGIIRDITERKLIEEEKMNLEEQFFQAQKMESIGRLAGEIAHDFNNILSSILGYAELLKISHADSESSEGEAAGIILEGVEKAAELTRQLLDFSRKGKFNPVPLQINDIVEDTVKVSGKIFDKKIELDITLDNDISLVEADRYQIEQVLTNIIINARDAMPDGGIIKIDTENVYIDQSFIHKNSRLSPGNYVRISVSDNGIGIDPETKNHIFEPFFTTKEEGVGTGLGLASAYSIIKNHFGFIDVESSPNVGSCFSIYLPSSEKESTYVKEKECINISKATLLVVDDEKKIRDMLKKNLEFLGYSVFAASDGYEAMQIYEEKREEIDLILLDIIMPQLSGSEIYKKIKKIEPSAKIVFLSGHKPGLLHEDIQKQKDYRFIQKPVKIQELVRIINESLVN